MEYDFGFWNSDTPAKVLEIQESFVNSLPRREIEKIKALRNKMQDVLKPEHNNYFLYKWLKARKFDVTAAETMLKANLKFREEYRVDHIQNEYKPPEVIQKYGTIGVSGEDREGSPVYIFAAGRLDLVGCVHSASIMDCRNFVVLAFEYAEVLKRKQTLKHGKIIRSQIAIIDLEHFRLRDFLWKPAMDFALFVSKSLEADYPECLKKGYLINAPKLFSVFWAIIKPILSEETKNKFFIFGKDNWKEAILEVVHPDQLPKHWGGNLVGPDGNPFYSPMINMGGKIPEEYYLSLDKNHNGMKSTSVQRQATCLLDITIDNANSVLSWTFQIEEHDIGFGIIYKPNEKEEIILMPIERFKSEIVPQAGSLLCEKKGKYCIVFDNSYSWYRTKKIYYEFQVNPL